ncbi:P-loop containing nucleoside triphosphate hydrolase [Phytophthora cactorum]|nr:P-loop containing nucleoside triphosphate hydrolase [Phytophthora cactorum]
MAASPWRNYATFQPSTRRPAAPNVQESAGFLSRIFLFWVKPLMQQAHKQQLNASDVWPLRHSIRADTILERFKAPLQQHKNSLPKAFARVFWFQFVLTGLAMLVSMLCNLVGPMALNRVVTALSDTSGEEEKRVTTAAQWVGLVFAAQVVQALADCYTGLQNEVTAIQCICLLKTLLFRKMMKLSTSSRKKKSTGELTNMYTADCESLVRTALVVHQMWLIPLQIVVASYMLVRREKDKRMKKVTEAFKAVSIVKLNAWENPITARISAARETELHALLKMRIMTSLSIVLLWGMPVFVSIAAFGTFSAVLHRDLTPAIVFTSLALFLLIQAPLRRSPVANGEFAWDKDGFSLLREVNFEVKMGEFVAVQGPVGCGKSSLCSALLGEMEKRKGTVFVGGSVAYCSQQPWIQNMTVKDNILFGHPFERTKYEKVLDACALTRDLHSLPAGDHTEIGERGVNLSGGQQARIALARACYSNASVYILDSPLSAVDAIVQNEIFEKCLLGLLRDKTIILVTHNPEIITSKFITRAVTLDDVGSLVETYRADSQSDYESPVFPMGRDFYSLSFGDSDATTQISTSDGTASEGAGNDEAVTASPVYSTRKKSLSIASTSDSERGRMIQDEARSDGRVSRHVFEAYYYAVGGLPVVSAILVSQMLWQALQISSDFWLSRWSNDATTLGKAAANTNAHTAYRLGVYAILGLLAALMVFGRTVLITIYGIRAARNLFDHMTYSLMHAPMRFFDANPIGRVLTRYGGDVAAVDVQIPFMFGTLAANVFSVGCSLATAAFLIRWKGFLLVRPERMQEYIDIEQEAPYRIPMMDPPAQLEWPTTGSIVFDKVSFRYKEGVPCKLASGRVLIDGVDVATIGLKTLREKLSIIPQSPVLFKGSLRAYLDLFDEFTDDQLWESIREVGLAERVAEDESKLLMLVEENGENFSVGERQMLCMARTLLRHARIVVFDEATAAIDHETDQKLQRVIRTAFAKSTVLTIAHRLDTILDSDRILVLDKGRLVEFASPAELVGKDQGHFLELMREGGYLDTFKQLQETKMASIA